MKYITPWLFVLVLMPCLAMGQSAVFAPDWFRQGDTIKNYEADEIWIQLATDSFALSSMGTTKWWTIESDVVGDSSDVTAALRLALDSAKKYDGIVRLDSGYYNFTDSVAIPEGVKLYCHNGTFVFRVDSAQKMICLTDHSGIFDVNIEGYVTGAIPHGGYGAAIAVGDYDNGIGYNDVTISGVTIYDSVYDGNGIFITGNSYNWLVDRVHILNHDTLLGVGVQVHWGGINGASPSGDSGATFHPHNGIISNLRIDSLLHSSISSGRGINLSGVYNISIKNAEMLHVSRAVNIFCGDYGFRFAEDSTLDTSLIQGQGIQIENVYAQHCRQDGIRLAGRAQVLSDSGFADDSIIWDMPVHVNNSTFDGQGVAADVGVHLSYCRGPVIENSTIRGFVKGVATFADVKRAVVRHCVITENGDAGVYISYDTTYGSPEDIIVDGCYIFDNNKDDADLVSAAGVYVGESKYTRVQNCRLGAEANEGALYGVYVTAEGENAIIVGNTVYDTHDTSATAYNLNGTNSVRWFSGNIADTSLTFHDGSWSNYGFESFDYQSGMYVDSTGDDSLRGVPPIANTSLMTTIVSRLRIVDVATDSAGKNGYIISGHWDNHRNIMYLGMRSDSGLNSDSGVNRLMLGGGDATWGAATNIQFFASEYDTAITGKERMRIDSAAIHFGDYGVTDSFYTFPYWDGASGQVLVTDGNSVLSWQDRQVSGDADSVLGYPIQGTITDNYILKIQISAGDTTFQIEEDVQTLPGGADMHIMEDGVTELSATDTLDFRWQFDLTNSGIGLVTVYLDTTWFDGVLDTSGVALADVATYANDGDTTGTEIAAGLNTRIINTGDNVTGDYAFTAGSVQLDTIIMSEDTLTSLAGNALQVDVANNELDVAVDDATIEVSGDALKVVDGGIGTTQIATSGVETTEILDGTVAQIDMANNSIGAAQIIDGGVGVNELADNSVGNAEMQDDAIGSAEMADEDHGDVTWASGVASVENDSHDHTTASISGEWTSVSDDSALQWYAANDTGMQIQVDDEITFVTAGQNTVLSIGDGTEAVVLNGNASQTFIQDDTLYVGDITDDDDAQINFVAPNDSGGIRYDAGTNKMQFSHDHATWSDLGTGSGSTDSAGLYDGNGNHWSADKAWLLTFGYGLTWTDSLKDSVSAVDTGTVVVDTADAVADAEPLPVTGNAVYDYLVAQSYLTGNETITLSGDATGTGATAITVTVVDDLHDHVYSNIDATTSANWAGRVSDETGTGLWVFGTNPVLTTSVDVNLAADSNITIDARSNPRTVTRGALRLNHTPEASTPNTRAIYLDVDANSVPGTQGMHVHYEATALAAGEVGIGIDVEGITSTSTGGVIRGLEVSRSGIGAAEVHAVHASAGVNPIHQEAGSFATPTQAWGRDTSLTAWANLTSPDAVGSSAIDSTLFAEVDDYLYVGNTVTFNEIDFVFNTFAGGSGISPTFQFSIAGPNWTTFTPIDNTDGCRQDGGIEWEVADLTSWASVTVNGVASYYVRILRNQGGGATDPIEDRIRTSTTVEYKWDSMGVVTVEKVIADSGFFGTIALQTGDTGILTVGTALPGRLLNGKADAHFGDSVSGMIELGAGRIGMHSDTTYNGGLLNVDRTMLLMNMGSPPGNFEFLITETNTNNIRLGIAKSGAGFGTWNARSGFFAGPSIYHDSAAYGVYWGFDSLDMTTDVDGADLGVQNDMQILGELFVDSIRSAGLTELNIDQDLGVSGNIAVTGTVDGEDISAIPSTYEVQLNNEAGLYAVLSDVTNFLQTGDALAGDDITDGSIDSTELATGAVDSAEIKVDAVDSLKIKNASVSLADIHANAYAKDIVTTAPLAGGTDNVLVGADGDVTLSIAAGGIDSTHVGDSTLSLDDINWEGGLVSARIDSVDYEKIESGTAGDGQVLTYDGTNWGPDDVTLTSDEITFVGDFPIYGHIAEMNIGVWIDIDRAWVEESPDTVVPFNTFLSDCTTDGPGACALHPKLIELGAGGLWGYDEAMFFSPIVCSTGGCDATVENITLNVRRLDGAWHTPIDSFSGTPSYDSVARPLITKDSVDADVAYLLDPFGFVDENGITWGGTGVYDETGGDTVRVVLIKGDANDITSWDCNKHSVTGNQMYRYAEDDNTQGPGGTQDSLFYIAQFIPLGPTGDLEVKYVSPQIEMLETGKYGFWINQVREDPTWPIDDPPAYGDTCYLLYFESQYPCSVYSFVDTVRDAEDSSSFFLTTTSSDSASMWHYSWVVIAPNVLQLFAYYMPWTDNGSPVYHPIQYSGGIKVGMSYDGGRTVFMDDDWLIQKESDTSAFAEHLYQVSGTVDKGGEGWTTDLYVSGKDSTTKEWGIGRVRIHFEDRRVDTTDTNFTTYLNTLDSTNITDGGLAEDDVNWQWEYLAPTFVYGRKSVPATDSLKLFLPHYDGGIILFNDSSYELAANSLRDTVYVGWTIPHAVDSIDSVIFRYYGDGTGLIDSLVFYGGNADGSNEGDSLYWDQDVNLSSSSATTVGYVLGESSLSAGMNFTLMFVNEIDGVGDWIRGRWALLKVKR